MSARSFDAETGQRTAVRERETPETVSSRTLFGKNKTLVIDHEGERYMLRITANHKLILTK